MAVTSSKYRLMLTASKKDNYGSLYKYLTYTDTDGSIVPWETDSLTTLDEKVESMLNGDYKKSDFIIVTEYDYNLLADIDAAEETSTVTTAEETSTVTTEETSSNETEG